MTMYDVAHLAQLRRDAELNAVDFTRGSIEPTPEGSFTVKLKAPFVDIDGLLDPMPSLLFTSRSALQAEGHLLAALLRIQRAERQRVRLGRVVGWSVDAIVRKPLTAEELADFKEQQAHLRKVAALQTELSEALQAKQARDSAKAEAKALQTRYGMRPAQPVPAAEVVEENVPVEPQAALITVETLLAQCAQATPVYANRPVTAAPSKRKSRK